jgi:hypothetical protein
MRLASALALLAALLPAALPASAQGPAPSPSFATPARPADARPLPGSAAQRPARPPRRAARLSGPRAGVTVLSPDVVRRINDRFREIGAAEGDDAISPTMPVVTQFGWQFETRLFRTEGGLTGITELVPLVGGLDRGILLPSATFLVGARTHDGIELGVGPNISATGVAYAVAAGFNNRFGDVNVPVNLAAALGRGGPRVSLLVGMTFSDRWY